MEDRLGQGGGCVGGLEKGWGGAEGLGCKAGGEWWGVEWGRQLV